MGTELDGFPRVESQLGAHLKTLKLSGVVPAVTLPAVDDSVGPEAAGADRGAGAIPVVRESGSTRYVRLGELGQGGMGTVYKVLDVDLHRRLALKVIRSWESGGEDDRRNRELLARFLEEAQVTSQLDHPGIVPLHEIGVDEAGRVFFTMRLVKGRHLGEIMKLARDGEEGWNRDRVLSVFVKICEAMAYAHARGVVHRDLKPENVMIGRFGEAYVMDWGLAKVLGRHTEEQKARDARASLTFIETNRTVGSDAAPRETMQGTIVGTAQFMSPEQARGQVDKTDQRSDVYSLGAMLYECISGQAPYAPPDASVSAHTILRWVLEGPPKPLRELAPREPADLLAICGKCMERDPAKRYQDMLEVAEDLRAFQRGRPVAANPLTRARRVGRWCRRNPIVTTFFVVLALGIGVVLFCLSRISTFLVERSAYDGAAMKAAIMEEVNALYSSDVVARVDPAHVPVVHDYEKHPGAIPLPATFLTELGDRISDNDSGIRVRHYSDHPFRFRTTGGPRDDFERTALAKLRERPDRPVHQIDEVDGTPTLRFASARLMQASCVDCHNSHPDSTKTDWQVGDVRGVLEIVLPLDRDIRRTHAGIARTLQILGGVAFVVFAFGAIVVLRQRR